MTLLEARLWFESLQTDNLDWSELQNLFRQQYSKLDNTTELFHVWRSFHFDENMETTDAYVMCIRQVAILLGYGELKILGIQKHSPQSYIGYYFPLKTSDKQYRQQSKENTYKRKDRQTTIWTFLIHSIYECKGWL